MGRYKVLAVNDEKDYCECCGRKGLKRVVFIEDTDTNEIKHFGTTCAVDPYKGFDLDKEVKGAIRKFESEQMVFWSRVNAEYKARGGKHVANPAKPGYFTANNPELKESIAREFRAA